MCGFAGFIEPSKRSGLDVRKAMSDSLLHRGPDDAGSDLIDHPLASVGLGFRRLAIIDLSIAGHQPMALPDHSVYIMLNGEIYNYKEVRIELENLGCKFNSNSDTEVVLLAYKTWGIKMIDRLIGMFAILILDTLSDCVFLIRDRAGVKPLFWYKNEDGEILFASELKAFHEHPRFKKELNHDALSLFLMNGSIPAPYTIFKNAFKVEPGNWVKVNLKSMKVDTTEYWNAFDAYNKPVLDISFQEAKLETEKLMQSAFNYRMVADVPVGVFLSGGYDSTGCNCITKEFGG
ncbi:MAG: asparagine synthetase B [Bacteroidetes bacterium]|nr:asparagine synthetase B [Bacteroidota bacterium]